MKMGLVWVLENHVRYRIRVLNVSLGIGTSGEAERMEELVELLVVELSSEGVSSCLLHPASRIAADARIAAAVLSPWFIMIHLVVFDCQTGMIPISCIYGNYCSIQFLCFQGCFLNNLKQSSR